MVKVFRNITPPDTFSLEQHQFIPNALPDASARLHSLEILLRDDLDVLDYPSRTWNYTHDPAVLEVAIIGAGHTGKSMAFGLRRHGITQVKIFDACQKGQAGPWRSYARNHTLRTPKIVTGGLDWGIPNLNFRRWCTACYGKDYYQQMTFIPRSLWADYLDWYAEVLELPIQYQTQINDITWDAVRQHFRLHASDTVFAARFVILATGLDKTGGKFIPPMVKNSLPHTCYAHTADEINFVTLKNKRIVVIGGGASAFDNANMAITAGATHVDLVVRRSTIPNINRIRWSEWNGYHRHFIDLEDQMKWYYTLEEMRLGQLPPAHTYYQAISNPRFTLYTQAPVTSLRYADGKIVGVYGGMEMSHDFLICGTGFKTAITQEPELQSFAPYIALWKDHFQPNAADIDEQLSNYPYLGKNLEFQPKIPGYDYLRRLYYLSSAVGWLSGFRAYLSGLQFAAPRVCYDISRQLFLEHQPEIQSAFDRYSVEDYSLPDFSGAEVAG